MRADSQFDLTDNRLLAALSDADRAQLRPCLHVVELPFGKVIHRPGAVRRSVYFPIHCVLSMQFVTSAGDAAEVASVGNEGLVGVPLLLGCTSTPIYTAVQVAGAAWRADGAALRREFARSASLQNLVLRFTQALMIQIGQNATCYQHHSVEQQFCLWLLLMLDRTDATHLHITQELIARTLGIRRETINEIASHLSRQGIIRRARGCIEVLDRPRLERASCECYGVIHAEYARLLPRERVRRAGA